MKYTITHVAEWVLLAIVTVLLCYTAWKSYTLKDKIEYITKTDTIHITDTITNWEPEYVYLSHFDSIKLPVVDTINDTVIKLDSILVQLPLDIYKFDSVIQDSTHTSRIQAVVSGFSVSLDTLSVQTEIYPQKAKKQPWYHNICPAVGVGYGTSGFGIFAGVGYKLN